MSFYQPDKICPLCKKHSEYKFLKNFENTFGKFSLYECLSCNGQFWLPFKNPGSKWHEKYDNQDIKKNLKPRQIHSYHKKFLNLNGDLVKRSIILDLGCGTGEFMAELENKGAVVYGTDIDKEGIKIAKNFYNFKNIYDLSINAFFKTIKAPQFDYITAFEVFEHIDDPWTLLNKSKELLKPNGKLIISTPSRERLLTNLSSWDFPYHHLSRWNEKSITYMLKMFGYKNIKIIYINKFHQLYDLFLESIAKKLKFKKAAGLKQVAKEKTKNLKEKKSFKKIIVKIIYNTGRFVGVILLPYIIAALFLPISIIFYPRSGIMYIEATK